MPLLRQLSTPVAVALRQPYYQITGKSPSGIGATNVLLWPISRQGTKRTGTVADPEATRLAWLSLSDLPAFDHTGRTRSRKGRGKIAIFSNDYGVFTIT